MKDGQTTQIEKYLVQLRQGDTSARAELIRCSCKRLEQLTRIMLRDYARLRRWEETGDVLQNALLRLTRSLEQVVPATARDFYRLAAVHIRRELIDLARHYFRPDGVGARHSSDFGRNGGGFPQADEPSESTYDPARLAEWTELHRQVAGMPEEDREIFDLLWYQGLTQLEAAQLIGVPERTLKRRWQAIRLRLHQFLHGQSAS